MNIQYNRFCNIASTNYSQYICFSIRDSILDNLLITSTLKSFEFFNFSKNTNYYIIFDLYIFILSIYIVDFQKQDSNMELNCLWRDVSTYKWLTLKLFASKLLARISSSQVLIRSNKEFLHWKLCEKCVTHMKMCNFSIFRK